jgi:hypothetical protein
MLPGKAAPLSLQSAAQAQQRDMIPGFIKAKESVVPKTYPAPGIPDSYQPVHHFAPETAGVITALPCTSLIIKSLRCVSPVGTTLA